MGAEARGGLRRLRAGPRWPLALAFAAALRGLAGLLRLELPRLQALGHVPTSSRKVLGDALHHQKRGLLRGQACCASGPEPAFADAEPRRPGPAPAASGPGGLLAWAPAGRRWPALLLALLLFGDLAYNDRAYLAYIDVDYFEHVPDVVASDTPARGTG